MALQNPDAEAAWSAEIERRVNAIEAGTVRLEPREDVKRRIENPERKIKAMTKAAEALLADALLHARGSC